MNCPGRLVAHDKGTFFGDFPRDPPMHPEMNLGRQRKLSKEVENLHRFRKPQHNQFAPEHHEGRRFAGSGDVQNVLFPALAARTTNLTGACQS